MKIIGLVKNRHGRPGFIVVPSTDDALIVDTDGLMLTDKYGNRIADSEKNHALSGFFLIAVVQGNDYFTESGCGTPLLYCFDPKWIAGLIETTPKVWHRGPPQAVKPFVDQKSAIDYCRKAVGEEYVGINGTSLFYNSGWFESSYFILF